jgi:molecular chaperone GrpE
MAKPKKSETVPRADYEELEATAKRIQADFTNYKRRMDEDRILIRPMAQAEVIERLLPVLDNFDRAAEHAPKELEGNDWVGGIRAIHDQLAQALHELGLTRIPTVGEVFEPAVHEAIADGKDPKAADHVVLEEFESGWRFGDQVLRPAKVRVNRK